MALNWYTMKDRSEPVIIAKRHIAMTRPTSYFGTIYTANVIWYKENEEFFDSLIYLYNYADIGVLYRVTRDECGDHVEELGINYMNHYSSYTVMEHTWQYQSIREFICEFYHLFDESIENLTPDQEIDMSDNFELVVGMDYIKKDIYKAKFLFTKEFTPKGKPEVCVKTKSLEEGHILAFIAMVEMSERCGFKLQIHTVMLKSYPDFIH